MDAAENLGLPVPRAFRSLDAFLAGLQSGTMGTLWMLAWMGLAATWQRRSFWMAENLMATAFYPNGGILPDFGSETLSGLALYLLLYGLLGGLFAMVVARAAPRPARVTMLAVIFALAWYYVSFHAIWKKAAPPLAFLHPERSTVFGHVIYGLLLGRFYAHFPPGGKPAADPVIAQETPSDSVAPKP